MNDIVITILAKDKEYCLDFYLQCILKQTFPKERTHLWIRTNDNKDKTKEILDSFVSSYSHLYKSVYYDYSDIDQGLKDFSEHEWNPRRFNILGKIRDQSIEYARKLNADYVVVDCDNFIAPYTVQAMYDDRHLGVVGPMLRIGQTRGYANFHHKSCPLGYMDTEDQEYWTVLHEKIVGKIKVSTLHCTYLIPHKYLEGSSYQDGTDDWEYIIFSNSLKRRGIPQYMDNTRFYGLLYLDTADLGRSYDEWLEEEWTPEQKELMQI